MSMNLRNIRQLQDTAAQRLSEAPSRQQIVVIYAALSLGLTALETVLNFVLGQIGRASCRERV